MLGTAVVAAVVAAVVMVVVGPDDMKLAPTVAALSVVALTVVGLAFKLFGPILVPIVLVAAAEVVTVAASVVGLFFKVVARVVSIWPLPSLNSSPVGLV